MNLHPYALEDLRLLGGSLCLDYVNTVEDRTSAKPEDFLLSAEDVVRWGQHAQLLDAAAATLLRAWATSDTDAADVQAAYAQAIALREGLYALFLAVATGQELPPVALASVQAGWVRVMQSAHLVHAPATDAATLASAHPAAWTWPLQEDVAAGTHGLDPVLGPVLVAALSLLRGSPGDLARVKVCANPHGCGWLFYDSSRNASRRWCSMEGCGSRIKMQRQYAKQKQRQARAVNVPSAG